MKLQQLILEIKVNNPKLKIPPDWKEVEPYSESDDYEEVTIRQWEAPMDGWDSDNVDSVYITKKGNIFKVLANYAFGSYEEPIGQSDTLYLAIKIAIGEMEKIKEHWGDDDY